MALSVRSRCVQLLGHELQALAACAWIFSQQCQNSRSACARSRSAEVAVLEQALRLFLGLAARRGSYSCTFFGWMPL